MSAHVSTFKDMILGVGTDEKKVGIKVKPSCERYDLPLLYVPPMHSLKFGGSKRTFEGA